MSKGYFSRSHTGYAEIAGGRAKAVKKTCGECGVGIPKRKKYCGPCYDARLVVHNDRNRKIYAAKMKARNGISS